jgi:hypothetical protein
MAPRTNKPRLASLSPDALARTVVGQVFDRLLSLEASLRSIVWVDVELPRHRDEFESTALGVAVRRLVEFAQTGAGLSAEQASTDVELVGNALYGQASDGDSLRAAGRLADDADLEIPEGLLFIAALGRVHLLRDQPLKAKELAALSGVTPQQIRHVGKLGELRLVEGSALAEEASRWLLARGIPGV